MISATPGDEKVAASFQRAYQAMRAAKGLAPPDEPPPSQPAEEESPALPEDQSGGYTRRPADLYPISPDRCASRRLAGGSSLAVAF